MLKHNNSNTFIEYLDDMDDIHENSKDHNLNKEPKIMILIDDIIAGMLSNKEIQQTVGKLFIRHRKLNSSFVFI